MKLIDVTVHKYKSYNQQQAFPIDDSITIIVGKNESGKTAILEAIAKTNYFSNDEDFKFNLTYDYPRKEKKKYDKVGEIGKAISCTYQLEQEEIDRIEEIVGTDVVNKWEFTVTIKYDNSKIITNPQIDITKFLEFIGKKHNLNSDDLGAITNLKSKDEILNAIDEYQGAEEQKLFEVLNYIKSNYFVDLDWDNWLSAYIWKKHLSLSIPKFMYFDEYYELPSKIDLETINSSNTQEAKTAKALLELADVSLDDLKNPDSYEDFKAELEAISSEITQHIFKYWRNNTGLRVQFDIESKENSNFTNKIDKNLNIRVWSDKHHISLPLSNRSKGFNWFFSFIVWFSRIQEDKSNQYILLLDEPGLNLHAAAQADLLKFLDDLSKEYQIIYTTHSPFMVPHNSLERVRTVYESKDGTTIKDAIEEKDSDTLFPLQAALGYDIAQNLFINKNNLLVEGVSDLVYLTVMSSILEESGLQGIKDEITIVPVGGLDKVTSFISLLRGQNLNIVCALDNFTDQKGKARLNSLIEQKIIKEKNVLFFNNFSRNVGNVADLEDMFDVKEYLKFFNTAFDEYDDIVESEIDTNKPIIQQINKIIQKDRYNHYRPSMSASKLGLSKDNFSQETLKRFENLFKKINSLF
ncbi:AAA family ATPase [Avibacterium paragallinarum]|uniref:AAA family ATPase n=1 Tax=Avibacterium TaxID=292486 RepID=UPI0021F72069|nr:ATP-binding protein [Avibacterium paragallinarum]UXN35456.1 ATP-binding protein [Avibacterium paragallinarum]